MSIFNQPSYFQKFRLGLEPRHCSMLTPLAVLHLALCCLILGLDITVIGLIWCRKLRQSRRIRQFSYLGLMLTLGFLGTRIVLTCLDENNVWVEYLRFPSYVLAQSIIVSFLLIHLQILKSFVIQIPWLSTKKLSGAQIMLCIGLFVVISPVLINPDLEIHPEKYPINDSLLSRVFNLM